MVNPYQSPQAECGPEVRTTDLVESTYRRLKNRVLRWMLGWGLALGVVAGLMGDGFNSRPLSLVAGILLVVLILQWCHYDRKERRIAPWPGFALMMILCPGPMVMMPVYLLATRGVRGILSVLLCAGFFLLILGMVSLGGILGTVVSEIRGW
jgi:hypothetical protein